jgi:hypothetical protein
MPGHIWPAQEPVGLAPPHETGEALGSWCPGAAGGNDAGSGERRRGEVGKVAEEEAGEERSPFWGWRGGESSPRCALHGEATQHREARGSKLEERWGTPLR